MVGAWLASEGVLTIAIAGKPGLRKTILVLMSPKFNFGNTFQQQVVRGDMFSRRVAKSEKQRHVSPRGVRRVQTRMQKAPIIRGFFMRAI